MRSMTGEKIPNCISSPVTSPSPCLCVAEELHWEWLVEGLASRYHGNLTGGTMGPWDVMITPMDNIWLIYG